MAKKGHEKKQSRPRAGILTKAVILVLLAAIGWQLYDLHGQIKNAQTEKEQYAAQVEAQRRENEALKADIEEGPTPEKIEEIARNELGLVKSGEYVFEPGN